MTSRWRGLASAYGRDRVRAAGGHQDSGDRGVGVEPSVYALPALPPVERLKARPAAPDRQSAAGDLESKVRAGTKWSMLNSIVLRAGSFLIGVVLARTVFGPADWGVYAISQITLVALLSVNELGVTAAIIRWEGDIRSFARTVVTLCLIMSTLMYVALYAVAPSIARAFGSPDATGMLRVLCLCVIIEALCAVPLALLNREFAQGRRMLMDCLNFAAGAGVTLWLAYTGHGVMSLAWGALAGATVALIVCTVVAPSFIVPGWNTSQARRLLRFGLPLAGANLFGLGILNLDSAIVGITLGPAMLGLYGLAFNISSAPVSIIAMSVQRISYAGFSRVADTGKGFARAFNRTLSLLMALTVPICVLLATLAEPLIHAVYGERWTPAAGALGLLALLGLMRVAFVLINGCIAAADKRSTLMGIQGLWLAALVPALLAGVRLGGITGVGAGHVLVAAALVVPASLWTLSRAGITVRSVARACSRPALGGALMAIATLLVIRLAGDGAAGLIGAIAAGAAVYLPVVYPMRVLLQRSARHRAHEDAAEPADSGTAASTVFDLKDSGG